MKLLGDIVHDVAAFFGVAECEDCKKRRKKLNDAHARLRGKRKAPCVECAKVRRIGR